MAELPYSYSRVSAWLETDGGDIPLVAVQIDYELNAIPTAMCVLPLGREGYTGTPSPAHSQLLSLTEPVPVTVKVSLTPRFGAVKPLGVPDGDFTIFRGYTDTFGYSKSMEPPVAGFMLPLRGWLSDLDYSSMFSQWSHPSNPAQYSHAAALPDGGAQKEPVVESITDKHGAIRNTNISQDLWTSALKPFFLGLCEEDGLEVIEQGLARTPSPKSGFSNAVAAAALNLMTALPSLTLDMSGDSDLADRISTDLTKLVTREDVLAGNTFWNVIVGNCAAEYLFAVSPRVNDALVIPYVGPLRQEYLTVLADEIASANFGGKMPRSIRAFGILRSLQNDTGAAPPSDSGTSESYVGGWYIVKSRKQGIVKIEPGPRWAGGCVGSTVFSDTSSGAFGGTIATAEQPDAAGKPDQAVAAKQAANKKAAVQFLSRYAKLRLVQEHTGTRQGTFTGPFRMDIAPGSSLALEMTSDPFLQSDQLSGQWHGSAVHVSFYLDAEQPAAWTSFHIGNLRTQAQNELDGHSLDQHPLYTDVFKGAPLLDG